MTSQDDFGQETYNIDTYTSYVVGIHHKNEKGQSRHKLLIDYLSASIDKAHEYNGYSDEEMLRDNFYYCEKLYKYPFFETGKITLKVETENRFDKDPIKVYHDKLGDLGYIPIIHKDKVRQILVHCHIVTIDFKVSGGDYKFMDVEKQEIIYGEDPLDIELTLYYHPVKGQHK